MAAGDETLEFRGDEAVVARSSSEYFAGEFESCGERGFAVLFEFSGNAIVVGGIGDDGNAFEIFCGGAKHGWPADVDIFNKLFRGEARLCGSGFKGIEIDDDEIDGSDAMFRRLFLVFG